jgi:hypothetical protein
LHAGYRPYKNYGFRKESHWHNACVRKRRGRESFLGLSLSRPDYNSFVLVLRPLTNAGAPRRFLSPKLFHESNKKRHGLFGSTTPPGCKFHPPNRAASKIYLTLRTLAPPSPGLPRWAIRRRAACAARHECSGGGAPKSWPRATASGAGRRASTGPAAPAAILATRCSDKGGFHGCGRRPRGNKGGLRSRGRSSLGSAG